MMLYDLFRINLIICYLNNGIHSIFYNNENNLDINYNENENEKEKYCEEGYKYILNNCVEIRNINESSYFDLYLIDFIIIIFFIIILIKKIYYDIL